MRLVKTADIRPAHCAVLPHIGHDHVRGFVDTGSELPGFDNHVYVSVVAIEQMAQLIGLPSASEVQNLALELQEARERIAELEAENDRYRRKDEAIGVLRNYGVKVERKPGRPRKTNERQAA